MLDGFLYLMKIRYSDGFTVDYQVEEDCLDCLVPRLILQPVVENAIVHGFSELEEDIGHIWVAARIEGALLTITVKDDGKGMTKEEIAQALKERVVQGRKSIGLANVDTRLILNFGEGSALQVESQPQKGTCVRLKIPVMRKEGQEDETSADRG